MTGPPRYWDGRVRQAVETLVRLRDRGSTVYLEALDCGHTKLSTFRMDGAGPNVKFRLCWECPGMEAGQ